MFKFNFNAEEEKISNTNEVPLEEEIQWYESKEIKIPPKISEFVENIPRNQIIKINYDCNFSCNCLSVKEVMNKLREKSENDELLDVLKADKEHSDLLSGKYEGGLKTWECTKDLVVYFVTNEIRKKASPLKGNKVLDLGCGSGILGIMGLQLGGHVVFQDYNIEVLEEMTIPNIYLNFDGCIKEKVKLYSGDWTSFLKVYSESNSDAEKFDYIFTSETIYNPKNYIKIIEIFKKLLKADGVAFVAAKSHYFGVGGNLDEFEGLLKTYGLSCKICWKTSEGVSRGILKVQLENNLDEKK